MSRSLLGRPIPPSLSRRFGFAVLPVNGGAPGYRIHRLGRLPEPYRDLHRTYPDPFVVDLERMTTPCGFSYAPDGWHPYDEALTEWLADPDLPYEHSVLCRYYERFRPTNVQQVLLEDVEEALPPLDAWPPVPRLYKHIWALNPRRVQLVIRESAGWAEDIKQHIGPQSAAKGKAHVARIVAAYRSMREGGYRPDQYRDGYVTGYFLERDGDYRFMIMHGNHRLAAFKALGIHRILARLHPAHPPVVNGDRLTRMGGVSRVLPADIAGKVFDKLFHETGRTKAVNLGII